MSKGVTTPWMMLRKAKGRYNVARYKDGRLEEYEKTFREPYQAEAKIRELNAREAQE